MNIMNRQAVIFDMDGTLFDTESVFQKEWNRLARERGIILPDSFKYEICGTSGDAMDRIIEKYYHTPCGRPIQRLCKERVAHILSQKVPEKEGCRDILSFFHDRGYALAIGSSSPMKQILANLQCSGLRSSFDAIASGDEVSRGKPAPDIFLLAAEKLKVSPENCLIFEDSPNGILAAHAAGMEPVMVPDLMPVTDESRKYCCHIFASLTEARTFFESHLPSPEKP